MNLPNFGVQIEQKTVSSAGDLETLRVAHLPILGRDKSLDVLKYNAWRLVAIDSFTQSFAWVVGANALAVWLTIYSINQKHELPFIGWCLLWGNAIGAWMYWAAREQFKGLLNAAADWIRGKSKTA